MRNILFTVYVIINYNMENEAKWPREDTKFIVIVILQQRM